MVPVRGDQEGLSARPFAQLGRPDALHTEGGPLAPRRSEVTACPAELRAVQIQSRHPSKATFASARA